MELELFAGVAVRDYPRAVDWYERLLGRPPTFHAHATECVWTLADHRSIYVVLDPDHAGHARISSSRPTPRRFWPAPRGGGSNPTGPRSMATPSAR